METQSYDETTMENMLGVPAGRNPRRVSYRAPLDNYEPAPRVTEYGKLVEYDHDGETRYMRATDDSEIPLGCVFIIDDGNTARPYYAGGHHDGFSAPLYPEGRVPFEMLFPFPVNPDGKRRPDNGAVIDYSGWSLGPRKMYHLKIAR